MNNNNNTEVFSKGHSHMWACPNSSVLKMYIGTSSEMQKAAREGNLDKLTEVRAELFE